jgi:hypothetical protein
MVVCVAIVLAGILAASGKARAQDEPFPVELRAGETFDACASGQIVCPAKRPICDDPNVAIPVDVSGGGLGFKGVGPGSTLCSAASAVGPRRVFRITVR